MAQKEQYGIDQNVIGLLMDSHSDRDRCDPTRLDWRVFHCQKRGN